MESRPFSQHNKAISKAKSHVRSSSRQSKLISTFKKKEEKKQEKQRPKTYLTGKVNIALINSMLADLNNDNVREFEINQVLKSAKPHYNQLSFAEQKAIDRLDKAFHRVKFHQSPINKKFNPRYSNPRETSKYKIIRTKEEEL